ncbi:hypothetical protein AB1Y20_019405 [Prymnesium parvum]|uniref:UBX domain-containing protein n=1 Tax=Prymnesium parvum TaxID=97485 RepID=A0AB34JU11_PRYPA|mmetsp:Transcript_12581/g.31376  ORF Transcript_12581/g.31376 Transcript_12581/m.31376 type:complete len:408 (-) Transcript_12581:412-1635(-)
MEAGQEEMKATFASIAACDLEFAESWLEANGWNLEVAVSKFMGNSGGFDAEPSASMNPVQMDAQSTATGFPEEDTRSPVPQFRDRLIDPALHVPQSMQRAPRVHPQEAFRDFKKESSGNGQETAAPAVFGLTKRPKNLAEMYAPPIELCFAGSFMDLCDAGRAQGKWLLINIQSPTEFGCQKLNADTWRDEGLRLVIGASFLFWQQYNDSPEGQKYCQRYLTSSELPHIGVVDPITGKLVKAWSGFKDAERLMDKLTEYADVPPQAAADPFAELDVPTTDFDKEMDKAIAASLAPDGPVASTEVQQPPPPEPEEEAFWADPLPDASGQPNAVLLAVRLPDGSRFQRSYPNDATLNHVFCAIHHCSSYKLKARAYQLTAMGSPTLTDRTATLASLGLVGRQALNLAEA